MSALAITVFVENLILMHVLSRLVPAGRCKCHLWLSYQIIGGA